MPMTGNSMIFVLYLIKKIIKYKFIILKSLIAKMFKAKYLPEKKIPSTHAKATSLSPKVFPLHKGQNEIMWEARAPLL